MKTLDGVEMLFVPLRDGQDGEGKKREMRGVRKEFSAHL